MAANQASTPAGTRQLRIGAALFAAVAGLLALGYVLFLKDDYVVLAQGIRPEQAAAVVEELKKEKVGYELRDGGTTILVPSSDVDRARLDVATGDLPIKGSVGFELFNQSDMGLTDFAQKVNYQRALQGEVARTIMAMDGIAAARVHVALPERSLFRTTRSEPRAAVTLTPDPGVEIDGERIAGIQRLVAATVPDLAIDQVAILNERGQLLTPEFSDVPLASSSESALEGTYRDRVAQAVANAVPRAHVQIKVTVVPRLGTPVEAALGPAPGTGTRNHAIRIVLFDRSGLSAGEEQAIRAAIAADLQLNSSAGDELLVSPAPQVAGAMPGIGAVAPARGAAPVPEQDRLMARIMRSWAIVFGLLACAALLFLALRLHRGRQHRRRELVIRIREQLLLVEGAASAA